MARVYKIDKGDWRIVEQKVQGKVKQENSNKFVPQRTKNYMPSGGKRNIHKHKQTKRGEKYIDLPG